MSYHSSFQRALIAWLTLGVAMTVTPGSTLAQDSGGVMASNVSARSEQTDDSEVLGRPARLRVEGVSLEAALRALESSSGVSIAYSPSLLPQDERATCLCEDATVEQAIKTLLGHLGIQILVAADQVIIGQRRRLPDLVSPPRLSNVLAANMMRPNIQQPYRRSFEPVQHAVSGTVTSVDQAPLLNVTVTVKGTAIGTLTDADGHFALVAPSPNDTLVFSSLGFHGQEIPIAGRSEIDVVLETDVLALDQLVVVGYGTQARESVTGSVSTLQSADIQRTSATTTTDAIIGKIAGINTRNTLNNSQFQFSGTAHFSGRDAQDGRPGATTAIQIRNMGDPLFVIDGIPQTQKEFDHLNAADIENVSVLKDAAASVYGFRAANGVILVTTKRGSPTQSPQLRVDSYYGWQELKRSRSPWGWTDNAYQYMFSRVETEQNTGQTRTVTPEEVENWRVGAPGYEYHDAWTKVINNQRARQANVSASLTGGAGGASYYLSLGHVTQDYVIRDNNFNRTNFQANLRTQLFDAIAVGTELRGRLENHITTAQTDASDPINMHFQSVQRSWPTENWYANGNPDYINGNVRLLAISPAILSRAISGTQDQIRRNFSGNFWAEAALPGGFRVTGTYNHTLNTHDFDIHRYRYDAHCYDPTADTYAICDSYEGGSRQHLRELVQDHFGQIRLNYDRPRFGPHSFSAVAALELSSGEGLATEVNAVANTNINSLIEFQDVTNVANSWYVERRASWVGRVNYDYEQKYLVEVLGRYDGSFLYAPGQRWGFFPGVSAGWRLTEERFLRDRLGFLDELKLRVSWGQAGREQGINPWGYLEGVSYPQGTAVLDGSLVAGAMPRGLAITNLSWVTSTTANIGLEFELLDRRLSGEIDVFERRLTGLPAPRHDVLLPSEVGYALPNENLESEANRGIEGILRYADRIGNLSFSIAPSATIARRKILDRYLPRYGNSWHRYRTATQDRWAGVSFQYKADGQFQSWEEIANHPVDIDGQGNRTLLPGDIKYVDVNGDGFIDGLDQRPVGYATNTPPILSFGLAGSFGYGNFTLAHDWAGGAAYSIWPFRLTQPYTGNDNGQQLAWSRWRRADPWDDQSEWIPGRLPPLRKGQYDVHSSGRRSDFYEFPSAYIRLNRVELAYSIPNELGQRFGFSNARVYASAHNVWILDNGARKWAMDPEQGQCCGQLYPPGSNITVGFGATLGGGPPGRLTSVGEP